MKEVDTAGLLGYAERAGADSAEVYIRSSHETRITVTQGVTRSASTADLNGAAVRVIRDHRLGFSYTSNLSERALTQAVDEAIDMSRATQPDEHNGLPDPTGVVGTDQYYDASVTDTHLHDKIRLIEPLHGEAQAMDPSVSGVPDLIYVDETSQVRIANTKGIDVSRRASLTASIIEVVAQRDGRMQSAFALTGARNLSGLDFPGALSRAVSEAVGLLGARQIDSCEAPVVFSPQVMAQIVAILSMALSADAVQKGRSMLAGREGKQVASPAFTLIDDPASPDGQRSQEFDGEGARCQPQEIISAGVLTTYFYDTLTARRAGRKSTGNGNRQGFRALPTPSPTNLLVKPSDLSLSDLLSQAGRGLYVSQAFGITSGGVDPIGGHMSVGVTGFWFENGKFSHPVREVTVAGRLFDLLDRIVATGSDLLPMSWEGSWSSPSVLIGRMAIAGK